MKQLLLFVLLLGSVATFAQGTVTGTVTDADLGGPMPSATVIEAGTSNGTVTDFDGNFSLSVGANSGSIEISYLGYTTQTVSYSLSGGSADLGTIALTADANTLSEVVIVGTGVIDLAEDRKTPVAVSTIRAQEIQEKVAGNVEITQALKSTPSAYISGQSGFGDSQLFLRGFDNSNIAVLLNGQPVNSMEDGRIFWSNWAGISDIANAIQVQRGLGSSKLAISSVGGTTNIVMKAADKKEGGFARFLGANDSYFKGTAAYNTGVSDSGWAFSVLLDHWQAHRKWSRGTYGQGQNYFFAVGYQPNDKHSFNFLVTGAPQYHGQKWSQSREIIAADAKFNQHWFFGDDGIESIRQNYYHKPVMNLNWDFTISDKTELSSVLYASWGRGGGTGPRGQSDFGSNSFQNPLRGPDPDGDGPLYGQLDQDLILANNAEVGIGDNAEREGFIRRASVNNHQWYGLITNLNHEFSDDLSVNVGGDVRLYTGDHFRQIIDLYGLDGWANDRPDGAIVTETFDADPWASLSNFADEGQRINYDYSEDINYVGGFGQIEYTPGDFSIFFQGAVSTQSYERENRFDRDDAGNQITTTSDVVSKVGYNLKGGISYTIEDNSTIFFNGGYYSRQPFLDNVFVPFQESVLITPEVDNEIIRSFEAGYHFQSSRVRANFNAYITDWDNRTTASFGQEDPNPEVEGDEIDVNILQRGIRQFHSGAEMDFSWRTTDWLTLNGYMSGGSWIFKGTSDVSRYNSDTGELVSQSDGVNRQGVKVSTAPQFTTGLGFRAKVVDGLSVDANLNYRASHYEFTNEFTSADDYTPAELKPYSQTDAGLTYKFSLGSNKLTFRANMYNVFDYIGISNTDRFGFFTENGRTYNASLRYTF
ncbi:MAG: TonB-dependent receptor [Flavobacteriaceae bacterium]|nr:TonB-dependent receptor [Flavobacteriaceae bacterium]